MTLGRTIRYLRLASRLSQSELARKIKITPSYLSLVEHDKREPSLAVLKRASGLFNIPIGFLLLQHESGEGLQEPQKKLLRRIQRGIIRYVIDREENETVLREVEE